MAAPQSYFGPEPVLLFKYITHLEDELAPKFIEIGADLIYFIRKTPMTESRQTMPCAAPYINPRSASEV